MNGTIGMKRKPGARNKRRIPLRAIARKFDRQNETAARIILSEPERHTQFQLDWARRFLARRAEEAKQLRPLST